MHRSIGGTVFRYLMTVLAAAVAAGFLLTVVSRPAKDLNDDMTRRLIDVQRVPEVHVEEVSTDVRIIPNLKYGTHARHTLDLYAPAASKFPTVVFVHGGNWKTGDKTLYGHVGRHLAKHGFGAAVINYRLHPDAHYPAQVEDSAQAVSWVKRHVEQHGGSGQIFLMGHSAGGQIVSLLATDETFLQAKQVGLREVSGVVSLSGLYTINSNVSFAGAGDVFQNVDKRLASPINHIKPATPPFLLVYSSNDYKTLDRQAKAMATELSKKGVSATMLEIRGEDHVSEMVNFASPRGTAYTDHIYRWMRSKAH